MKKKRFFIGMPETERMFPGGFRKERNPRESFRHCVLQSSFSRGLVSENSAFAVFQADLKEIGSATENLLSGQAH